MCGRFEALQNWLILREMLRLQGLDDYPAGEIRPTDPYPIIVRNGEDADIVTARWSLIPHWYNGPVKDWKASTFNARIEEVADKPAFRDPWASRHCLVPVEAFYEWTGDKKARQKLRITSTDNHPIVFAGLWDVAETADARVISFTILTRAAGPDMAAIHDREPVVLHPDQWQDWLQLLPVPDLFEPANKGTFRLIPAAPLP